MTIQRSPGTGELVDQIRAAILRGRYSPNERLVEGDLAQAFASTRGAVRAALFELSTEGLVEREVNRGARVRSISRGEAIEICEIRMALEGLLAAKAAVRATAAELDELHEIIAAMERAVAASNVVAYSELNLVLHRRVRELAGHPSAARIVELIRNQSIRIQLSLALAPGRVGASLEEHRAVVEAIAGGDPAAAEAAMRAHLGRLLDVLAEMDDESIR